MTWGKHVSKVTSIGPLDCSVQGMRLGIFILAFAALISACDRDTTRRQTGSSGSEGKAMQSAGGGSANEGKAAGAAGR